MILTETQVNQPVFIFDVESIGLHGEAFAVAGATLIGEELQDEFLFSCPPKAAQGTHENREWVAEHIPRLEVTHANPRRVADAFWAKWVEAKETHEGIFAAAECLWPVEARFFALCVDNDLYAREWGGPYPFHDLSSIIWASGQDPMSTQERLPEETPAHHPLMDVRQSARLFREARQRLVDANR